MRKVKGDIVKKYQGMCAYYKGFICDKLIEAETESQLFRLASSIANKQPANQHILFVEYISVNQDMSEASLLPQQYYVRLAGQSWQYKGNVPVNLKINLVS